MCDNQMLPRDPFMLLSYINTQLRDHYPSLQVLCAALDIDESPIRDQLARIDYAYDEALNKFV